MPDSRPPNISMLEDHPQLRRDKRLTRLEANIDDLIRPPKAHVGYARVHDRSRSP